MGEPMRKTVLFLTVALLLGPLSAIVSAAPERSPAADSGGVYGRQLMTPQEEEAYRRKMWELKTESERERFRREHHRRMQERARDLGVHLPDDPVLLDRPYFGNSPGTEEAGKIPRSGDSLRRWPERNKGKSSLRRWPGPEADAQRRSGGLRPEDVEPEAETRADGGHRWPPKRKSPIRPEETGKTTPAPRLPPGSGR